MDRAPIFKHKIGAVVWNVKKIVKKGDYLYAVVPEHPNATKNHYVLAHRIVMENHLKRLLDKNEVVHHLNGNKHDNRLENLEIHSNAEHARLHRLSSGKTFVKFCCPNCGDTFVKSARTTTHKYKAKSNHLFFCSKRCSGQYQNKTRNTYTANSVNILEFFKDNTEQSDTTECVETIYREPEMAKR
jgi:predicted RNA-binding Zn-ribbon protein involved in translation (DUF1610 family)